jgi:hypothetical protein
MKKGGKEAQFIASVLGSYLTEAVEYLDDKEYDAIIDSTNRVLGSGEFTDKVELEMLRDATLVKDIMSDPTFVREVEAFVKSYIGKVVDAYEESKEDDSDDEDEDD